MGFDFKRALRRATFMAMMDEEREKEKAIDPLEDPDRFWLEKDGLDYNELNAMDPKERNKILAEYGYDPGDIEFDNEDF